MSHRYKDLMVWQKARNLACEIYRATGTYPKSELYGLMSQSRRAAVSVASNVAEGQGRITKGEFLQFLGHSRGSLLEPETQLAIAVDLNYTDASQFHRLETMTTEVGRLLNGLIESLHVRDRAAGA